MNRLFTRPWEHRGNQRRTDFFRGAARAQVRENPRRGWIGDPKRAISRLGTLPAFAGMTEEAALRPECHCVGSSWGPAGRTASEDKQYANSATLGQGFVHGDGPPGQAAEAYRVCELVETCGPAADNEEIAAVLALHDELACSPMNQELA